MPFWQHFRILGFLVCGLSRNITEIRKPNPANQNPGFGLRGLRTPVMFLDRGPQNPQTKTRKPKTNVETYSKYHQISFQCKRVITVGTFASHPEDFQRSPTHFQPVFNTCKKIPKSANKCQRFGKTC